MSPAVVAVAPGDSVEHIVRLMERHRIKRVPVIENSKLVGIVSRANLVRALMRALTNPTPQGQMSDEQIRDRILTEISRQPWGPRASVTVRVNDRVVELCGAITDERERTALQVLAEGTPGVKSVRDQLVWVEPLSGFVIPADASESSS